jgi:hypothetical protein
MEKTKLHFGISLDGRMVDFEAVAKIGEQDISSGQRISLGPHRLTMTHPKAEAYSTKLFTWYGGHDLGTVKLKRSQGTLQVTLNRPAKRLKIHGPDWGLVITNSSGGSWVIPTDRYQVDAEFAFTKAQEYGVISASSICTVRIAPGFGNVHITSSHPDTSFRLKGRGSGADISGTLPAIVDELPIGSYDLTTERLGDEQTQTVLISADQTNEVLAAFSYGALTLDSEPQGATVFDHNGRERGRTPVSYPEMQQGTWRFRLEREGYEPLLALVEIHANKTNLFQTNLVSRQYVAAMRTAHDYFAAGQYADAGKFAEEALGHKPGDIVAASLKREATGLDHVASAKTHADRTDFTSAIKELNAAAEFLPENAEVKVLVARYSDQRREVEKREAERRAKERADEERQAKITKLKIWLATECRRYNGFEAFSLHVLSSTNDVKAVGKVLPNAMTTEAPVFEMIRYEWQHGGFIMDYKQKVFDGSRECVIVGTDVSTNECVVCYRVIESQTPHGFNWAGGLISGQFTTEEDRNGERAARFQKQIKEGAQMVEERIRKVIELAGRE